MKENNVLKWLQDWYFSECNGDWEHSFGIKISTIDNPGWSVKIDLKETNLENMKVEHVLIENSEDDWYAYKIDNSKFESWGDPTKLEIMLEIFKNIVLGKKRF